MDGLFDRDLINRYDTIIGIDEAGRGPLAGPVVAAAVFLDPADSRTLNGKTVEDQIMDDLPFLDDSKKLSRKKRETVFDFIQETSISFGIGLASQADIDRCNILNATAMAMQRAVEQLNIPFSMAIVDGKSLKLAFPNIQTIKGDSKSIRISLASNIAKVYRDRLLIKAGERFREYGFERHKGYGTKEHREAIKRNGPLPFHRLTFSPVSESIDERLLEEWHNEDIIDDIRMMRILEKRKQLNGVNNNARL